MTRQCSKRLSGQRVLAPCRPHHLDVATIVPIRFRDSGAGSDRLILDALREHGAEVSEGAVTDVYELCFETEDPSRLRRSVTDALRARCPGWETSVEIFWPE